VTRPASKRAARRTVRALAVLPAVVVTGVTGTAYADAPATWENSPNVTFFHGLLIYLLVPLALFVIITLLAYLPSMRQGSGYQPGQTWRSEPEWFGGPRAGVQSLDAGTPAAAQRGGGSGHDGGSSGRGGFSGHW
jgi:uncharacterized membrane protein YgcG